MITIEDLAGEIQSTHDVDTHTHAVSVVTVHVDNVAADPDLWDADTETLTDLGAELVRDAIAQAYAQSQVATRASQLLEDLADAAERRAALDVERADVIERRDALIRSALRTELTRSAIAAAGGVTMARLYQIRDGRR